MDKKADTPVYEIVQENGRHTIQRNGRTLMTPAGEAFSFDHAGLAEAVLAEWRAQGEKIDHASMPLTQLAATAFDIIAKNRKQTIDGLLAFTSSELLCQRAERPETLVKKQVTTWQPIVDWCATGFGVDFTLGCGVMPVRQQERTIYVLREALSSFDNMILSGLKCAVECSGSLILGLALAEGKMSGEEVLHACELDVKHQAESWGDDPVTLGRQSCMRDDFVACEKWFALLRS